MEPRKRLGEIFVEENILTPIVVERVLAIAKGLNKRFGTVLEEMGLVTGDELASALARQYGCRTAFDFAKYAFPPQLLAIIPAEVALQHLLFPLKVADGKLALAMVDPTNTRIVNNIAANNNLTIVPFVAPYHEINRAICKHYLGRDVVDSTQRTVLVAEDDKLIQTMLRNVLSVGYEVHVANDGMEAYKVAVSSRPHVILTDKEMPKLDGYGLLDALRGLPETKSIPVILISGGTSAEDAEAQAFEKGFFDFIHKPVRQPTVVTRVKRACEFYEKQYYLFRR